jgi:hypothetical protein
MMSRRFRLAGLLVQISPLCRPGTDREVSEHAGLT